MLTSTLRAQHTCLLEQATLLGGLVASKETTDTASRARRLILAIDGMLVEHLTIEDAWLYPVLMAAKDAQVRDEAALYSEEMGGILGAWIAYRTQWDEAAINGDMARFRLATSGIIGALAMRIEAENTALYPAMDRLLESMGPASAAA